MRTSELYKDQPVLRLLAPAGPNTAPLGQPGEGAFHHPAACRMLFIVWYRFWYRLIATAPVANVFFVVGAADQLVDVCEIIPLVQTEVLLTGGAPDHNRENEVINRPFVMLIGASDVQSQGSATFVNQEMDLGPTLSTIRWIAACGSSTQGSRDRLAVDGLPFPADTALPGIEADQVLQDLVPDACLLPGLEPFMQHTAGNSKPIPVYRFPLTACPQHIPDAIDDSSVVCTRSAGTSFLGRFGKILLDTPPQRPWDTKVIDIFRFCVTLVFANDAPRWIMFFRKDNSPRGASFCQLISFSDRFLM
jgi:hypothetical protein